MRYELKMVFPETECADIIDRLRWNSHVIREVFFERQVNNIYYDSLDYLDYLENMHGVAERKKCRVRWYGNLRGEVSEPTLELKYKQGMSGGKKTLRLPGFIFADGFSYFHYASEINKILLQCDPASPDSMLISELLSREPSLVNHYTRRYFLTCDGKYRFKLDRDIWYGAPDTAFLPKEDSFGTNSGDLVLELKFSTEDAAGASEIMNELGYRISKNSKYAEGLKSVNW